MALIKCKNCKKDISTSVKFCPHCGESNIRVYCRECGKEMALSDTACSNCGYIVNQISQPMNQPVANVNGNQYELSLVAFICSLFVPVVGLVLGIVSLKANKGLKNQAKTFGLVATIISSASIVFAILFLILYFVVIFVNLY